MLDVKKLDSLIKNICIKTYPLRPLTFFPTTLKTIFNMSHIKNGAKIPDGIILAAKIFQLVESPVLRITTY